MDMKEMTETIKTLSNNVGVLYVEDNLGLSKNVETLLSRIFKNVHIPMTEKRVIANF